MERFYNNNNDDDKHYEEEDDDMDEVEMVGYMDQQSILEAMQIDLDQTSLNQKLLDKSMAIAKSDIFWLFKKTETRLKEIETIYNRLSKLIDLEVKEGK